MTSRGITSYNNQSKQSLAGAKLLAVGELNVTQSGSPSLHAATCVTATPQEIMYSPTANFTNQGGASWDAIITPFQINGSSTRLPTMPTSAGEGCVKSQSNQVDPPIDDWTPPIINISYLNPFMGVGALAHGTATHYDGTILFNGGASSDQNLINRGSVPSDLRPMALRGPLIIQGWGYDLNGKPIPNEQDDEDAARGGEFVSSQLKDEFLDKWTEKRETWPVAPVDLRYDRTRKVWTVPSTFRIIQAKATESDGVPAGNSGEAQPLNIEKVYKSDGTEVEEPKITVTNPSWNANIESGKSFFAFYDTKDCTYYPLAASGGVSSGSGVKIRDGSGCGYSPSVSTCQYVTGCITFGSGLGVVNEGYGNYAVNAMHYISSSGDGRCPGSEDIAKTYFNHLNVGSGLKAKDNGDCSFTIESCDSGVKIAANPSCSLGPAWGPEKLELITFEHGFDVTVDGGTPNAYIVDNDLRFGGNRFADIIPRSGLQLTASADCVYYLDATGIGTGCDPVVVAGTGISVETGVDEGCVEYTVSFTGCETTLVEGTGIQITKDECEYTIDAKPTCHNTVSVSDDCLVLVETNLGDCTNYDISISGGCKTNWENPSWSLCGYPVENGDDITFSTVGCASVDCSSHNVEITVPGTTITAGSGIQVTADGSCGHIIDAEVSCNTIVGTTDDCLIVTGPSPGVECPEYLIEIKQSCKDAWDEKPSWELCNWLVADGANVTVSGGGCATVDCDAGHIQIDVPCTTINGGHCISVVENSANDFTISVTGSCTGGGGGSCTHEGTTTVAFVSDVCCVGSGLDIKYGSMTFVDGCFSGYTTSGC